MARDRQRAKQRKQQRRAAQNPGPAPTEPHRENIPGALDHASGQVEEFEAALVAGAGGEPVLDDEQLERDHDVEDLEDAVERDPVTATGDGAGGGQGGAVALSSSEEEPGEPADPDAVLPAPAAAAVPAEGRRGNRFVNFLRASWAELQRVQWPDRRQVGQATAVVLGFVVIAGAYLGVADALAQKLVDLIL